jgi:glucans biosynthesis protein
MNRRQFLASSVALLAVNMKAAPASADSSLLDVARNMRDVTYTPNTKQLPPPFANLSYNAYRGIRPIVGKTALLLHGENFSVDLMPPGLYFPDPVKVDRVTQAGVQDFAFSTEGFSFDPRYFAEVPSDSPGAGFSGMRLRYPLNAPGRMDEVLVMQGASYFRAVGAAMVYGLSARTVAIGTGGSEPEEFPRFVHLRLHPAQGDSVRLEGVVDSPSLTAHLDMTLQPGTDTIMNIVTTIFPRVVINDIGVAPLTSMYLKGPMLSAVSDDFRPRVHDSDALVIHNGAGERIWRPIANPRGIEISAFADRSPKAFGLYQTTRAFDDYQDPEARYHDRPSATVAPAEPWGEGAVTLVELPTKDEFQDNIVAFWRPAEPLQPDQTYRFAYTLTWTRGVPDIGSLPAIVQARSGREHDRPRHRRFVIDIAGSVGEATPQISASNGAEILGISAFALPDDDVTRVTFLLAPGDIEVTEIRLVLSGADGAPQSPVWLHRWTPTRDGGV